MTLVYFPLLGGRGAFFLEGLFDGNVWQYVLVTAGSLLLGLAKVWPDGFLSKTQDSVQENK